MESGSDIKKKVLIVDDQESIRSSLSLLLQDEYEVEDAENGLQALDKLEQERPDVLLLDVMMPECDGLETLKRMHAKGVKTPVIMLTANNTVDCAVNAMKLGACDFVSKPFDFDDLSSVIRATLAKKVARGKEELTTSVVEETQATSSQASSGSSEELPAGDFGVLVGKSALMQQVFQKVELVAKSTSSVLITGESGTGKELIARRIHELSDRSQEAFVPLNCAAIPESLIESELFGHEKGAFTNAASQRIGYCEHADGGTLFLDEIGELSLAVQVKLLRFLQEQEFNRVGSTKARKVNVRVLAATNKNLEELVKEGKFREDLFYRIHVIHIELPPLRDRFDDVEFFIPYFMKKHAPLYGQKNITFTDAAKQALVEYAWPGNVRELENVVESILALSVSETVGVEDLPKKVRHVERSTLQVDKKVFDGSLSFQEAEKAFETEIILKALKRSNYVQTRAAELLGISRRILKYKMDKLGISEHLN